MRWAKIKTTVLIFLAARLAKWTDYIERKIDYRELPVEDENEVSESFSDGETRSGVPEHWARLNRHRPPQAWLDLIRERAPHLLSNSEDELRAEEGADIFDRESVLTADEVQSIEDDVVERSRQEILRPVERRNEPVYYAEKNRKATWLKRLHFRRPAPLGSSRPVYLKNSETREPAFTGAPGNEGSEARDERQITTPQRSSSYPERERTQPTKLRDAVREKPARPFQSSVRMASPGDDDENRWANIESAAARNRNELAVVHAHDQQQFEPSYTNAQTNSRRGRNEAVKVPPPKAEQRKSPFLQLRRPDDRKRSSLTRSQQNVAERAANVTHVSPLDLRHVKTRRATPDNWSSASHATATTRTRDTIGVRTPERARNEFASLNFASSEYNPPLTESGESIWPALPVAHDPEPADEIAAMQREAERVRRLELEQRGALWNA